MVFKQGKGAEIRERQSRGPTKALNAVHFNYRFIG